MLEGLFSPFLGALPDGTNVQSLGKNARIAIGPLLCVALVVYSLLVTTNVDDDGMNALEIDDSEEGIRRRFTLWTVAFAFALGLTLAGGIYEVGEALSMPQYTKDVNEDGILDQPGSWGIEDGTGFEITPFFLAMVMGLTLFTASVVAEIVRGSIQSLPRGQVEAAISLSLNPYQRLRLVILPQALRSMIPLMNNQFMNVWKNSSLAIVVAYTDIFYVILVMMNNVGKLIPLFLLLLVTYQIGSLIISTIMNWYNSRITSVKI
jgi:ABC-type amino acid transport system permease subunit